MVVDAHSELDSDMSKLESVCWLLVETAAVTGVAPS